MNEPANFGTNMLRPWNWPEDDHPYWSLKCPEDALLDHPAYRTSTGNRLCNIYITLIKDVFVVVSQPQLEGPPPPQLRNGVPQLGKWEFLLVIFRSGMEWSHIAFFSKMA